MKRRLIALAVVGAVAVGLLVAAVGASPARPFVGLNAYELATDYGVNNGCGSDIHTSTDAFFASLPTGTVVRFWAMQPFGTASANTAKPGSLTWGPLDNVFATTAKYGDKLIPVLGNQWGDCDGVNEAPGVQLGQAFYSGGYTSNTSGRVRCRIGNGSKTSWPATPPHPPSTPGSRSTSPRCAT